ncbi:unnamed protein product, partial [Polarella glacialis]
VRGDAAACHRWTATALLIVDEVSMVSGRLLDVLDAVGRSVRGCPGQAFGGLQVLLCGDFHQLPPPGKDVDGWAFEAKVWGEAFGLCLELTQVLRLRSLGEAPLAEALEQVRAGKVHSEAWSLLQRLSKRPREPDRLPAEIVPTN